MKPLSRILADIALLPVSGCIFPDNRDYSENIAPTSATLGGHHKPIRTMELKKPLKPRLSELGLKG